MKRESSSFSADKYQVGTLDAVARGRQVFVQMSETGSTRDVGKDNVCVGSVCGVAAGVCARERERERYWPGAQKQNQRDQGRNQLGEEPASYPRMARRG